MTISGITWTGVVPTAQQRLAHSPCQSQLLPGNGCLVLGHDPETAGCECGHASHQSVCSLLAETCWGPFGHLRSPALMPVASHSCISMILMACMGCEDDSPRPAAWLTIITVTCLLRQADPIQRAQRWNTCVTAVRLQPWPSDTLTWH
jgi:hypothetical protein